jgi:hypothetical protein
MQGLAPSGYAQAIISSTRVKGIGVCTLTLCSAIGQVGHLDTFGQGVHETFRRMLAGGEVPDGIDHALRESRKSS